MLELHIGRLRFCFGFSFFLLLAVVCRWQAGSMLLFSFLAILLHEIGHLLAILLTKTAVKSINFTAFGVHIVRSAVQFVPPLRLVVVYLAGPGGQSVACAAVSRQIPGGRGRVFRCGESCCWDCCTCCPPAVWTVPVPCGRH